MSLVVVATMTPQSGKLQELTNAFERVASAIQAEPGCELYAIHSDGSVVVTIERWESEAALDAHMKAPSVVALLEQGPTFLAKAPEIVPMQALGFGDPVKGTI